MIKEYSINVGEYEKLKADTQGIQDVWLLYWPLSVGMLDRVKRIIAEDVLVSHYDHLTSLTNVPIPALANKLYAAHLIGDGVRDSHSMKEIICEFKSGLKGMKKLSQIQEHCQKFLNSFIGIKGSYAYAAIALREDWVEAVTELGLDFNINIDS